MKQKPEKTDQEKFWEGEFGDAYIDRNRCDKILAAKIAFFSKILSKTRNVSSVIEFGANIGWNLTAIKHILPDVQTTAVEINQKAVDEIKKNNAASEVLHCSIFDFSTQTTFDLSFTRGVLIHLNPDRLQDAYEIIYHSSHRYILISEYYNPIPIEVEYRGHKGKLFKRDFAGEMMDRYPDIELVDYGCLYHRDPNFFQGDSNWFLLEKLHNMV